MRPGIAEFDAGRVNPADFNHAEHIRMGWLYLVAFGKTRGSTRFREALNRFTTQIGADAKYHETITCFFLNEIGDRLTGSDWPGFKAANPDLFDAKTLLDRHYSAEVLNSHEARSRYVPPCRSTRAKAS